MVVPPQSLLSRQRPFPGLRPFADEDHEYFFGRQGQKLALYRLIDRSRFVAVVGSSGSGKSSLVRAGLVPLLDRERQPGGTRLWRRLEMRPGHAPLEALAAALAELAGESDEALAATRRERIAFQLRQRCIEQALTEAGDFGASKLLLLIDQFEELFRFVGSQRDLTEAAATRGEAVRFVQLLIEASRLADKSITVVLTMRSDFIGDCALFQGLPEVVSANQYLVPALTRDQREEIIRKPIEKAGATIEPILVERLLNDSGSDLDQLPVLQHCLLRIWQQAGDRAAPSTSSNGVDGEPARELTEADYEAVGFMQHAMSRHADRICEDKLPGFDREIERMFRALSELRDNRAIRRVVSCAALRAETGTGAKNLRKIFDAFRDDDCSFLVPSLSMRAEVSDETPIDIGHEALLRRWRRLTGDPEATGEANDPRPIGWLREERRDARRYESLLSMAESAKNRDVVLDPGLTADYADWWKKVGATAAWAARYGARLELVEGLIARSVRHVAELTRQAEEHARYVEEQKRVEEQRERQRRRRQWMRAGSIAVCIVACFAFFLGFREYRSQSALRQATQVLALQSANDFVQQINKQVSVGNVQVKGAQALLTTTNKIVEDVGKNIASVEALRLNIQLMLAEFDVYWRTNDMENAGPTIRRANSEARKLPQDGPDGAKDHFLVYDTEFRLGDLAARNGDNEGALHHYRLAREAIIGLPSSPMQRKKLGVAENKIGEALQLLERWPEALQSLDRALAISDAALTNKPSDRDWQVAKAATLVKIALVLTIQSTPDHERALKLLDQGIEIQKGVLAIDNTNNVYLSNLATSYVRKANLLSRVKRFNEAFPVYQLAIDIYEEPLSKDGDNAIWLDRKALYLSYYGDSLGTSGDLEAAIDLYKRAIELRHKLLEKSPKDPGYLKSLAKIEEKIRDFEQRRTEDKLIPPRQ